MASLATSRNLANKTENRIQVYAEIKKSYDVNFSLFFFFLILTRNVVPLRLESRETAHVGCANLCRDISRL